MRKFRLVLVVSAMLGSAMLGSAMSAIVALPASASSPTTWYGTVDVVLDGDTFEVDWAQGYEHPVGRVRIRILGLDANEVSTNECLADEATTALEALLSVGEPVKLEAQHLESEALDRPLRHVFVDQSLSTNVALELVNDGLGLAAMYDVEPDYRLDYLAAGEQAMVDEVGLWEPGICGGDPNMWPDLDMTVNYDAAGDDAANLNDEYIQLRNTGAVPLDLGGWSVRSSARLEGETHSLPAGTILGADAKLRIHVGSGTNTAADLYLGRSEPWLDNEADVVYLRDTNLNMRGAQFWPCTVTCGDRSAVVIEDVAYNAAGNDATNPNGEWVKIRNRGDVAVDLTDWRLKDDGSDYPFNDGEILPAGESLTVHIGSGSDNGNVRFWGNSSGILNNTSGDQTLAIRTPQSIEVDCYSWVTGVCPDEDIRGAIELSANFNAAGNDTTNPNGEWVALRNTSASPVDLSGFKLYSPGRTFTFSSGTVIGAHGYHRVLVGSGSNSSTTSYWGNSTGIMNNSGEYVDLRSPTGDTLLHHSWPCSSSTNCGPDRGLVISEVNYDAAGNDATNPNGEWVKIKNTSLSEQNLQNWKIVVGGYQYVSVASRPIAPGSTATVYMGAGTNSTSVMYWGKSKGILLNSGSRSVKLLSPFRAQVDCHSWGSANCGAQSVAAAISITANYDAAGDDASNLNGEWININNSASTAIDLDGYELYTDGTSYAFGSGTSIPPDGRLRVYLGAGSDSASVRYADGQLNALANSGDEVSLRRLDTGGDVDEFVYPCGSVCRPVPDVTIGEVNYDATGSDATNPNGEWVKVVNNSSGPVDLRDWMIQYKTAAVFDIESSATLAPGAEMTLFVGVGVDGASERYWGYSSGVMSNSSGVVKLWSSDRQIADSRTW